MVLPIVAYGDPVLKRVASEIPEGYEGLQDLIADMWETMYNAQGLGLAAPQIGRSLRLFVIDTAPLADDDELSEEEQHRLKTFKQVFINARMTGEQGEGWDFNEGCLSIPDIREDVSRRSEIEIEFQDEDFNWKRERFNGLMARVIQHEYDHIEGVLFTDHLSPLKRRLLKGRLDKISRGRIQVDYRMKFPNLKKVR
jgi:peptide deformylase